MQQIPLSSFSHRPLIGPQTTGVNAIIISLFLAFVAFPVFGDVRMSPSIKNVTARPGAPVHFTLGLSNTGDSAREVRMEAGDMELSPMGLPQPAQDISRGCSGWLTFDPQRSTIDPGGREEIRCTLKPPHGTQAGGYYAYIDCFSPSPTDSRREPGANIRLATRVRCALLVTVIGGPLEPNARPVSMDLTTTVPHGRGHDDAPWMASVEVENSGNIQTRVAGRLVVLNDSGQRVAESDLDVGRGWVLAGGKRVMRAYGESALPDGVYLLQAELRGPRGDLGGAAQAFTLFEGEVTSGKPTEEVLALIEQTRPKFAIEPLIVKTELPARGRRVLSVVVRSMYDEPLTLTPCVIPFTQQPDGSMSFPVADPPDRFVPEALSLSPERLTVRPRSRQNMRITVHMPEEAEGELFAAIALVPEGEELPDDPYFIRRRSCLAILTAKGTEDLAAEVEDITTSVTEEGARRFAFTVRNTGNVSCQLEGLVSVSRGAEAIDRLQAGGPRLSLLPGCSRRFEVTSSKHFPSGHYSAGVMVALSEDASASETTDFTVEAEDDTTPQE